MNNNPSKKLWPKSRPDQWMRGEYVPGLASVIVPTFNRAQLLVEAMDSVYEQYYRPIELLLVDDGSTDDTSQVVEDWRINHCGDDKLFLRYFTQENSGAPAARNLGLIESRGEYIQFLDSDDLLHPEKLQRQVANLAEDEALDFVYSGTGKFGEKIDWNAIPYTGLPVTNAGLLVDFLRGRLWNTRSGIYRRRACVAIGPWDESVPIYQDWEYNIRFILSEPKFLYVARTLSMDRVIGRDNDKDRITNKARSGKMLRAILSLNIEWERWIRDAGKMEKKIEWLLADRRFGVTVKALRQGFTDLAREAADSGSGLEAEPGQAHKFAIWRFLALLPGPVGSKLASGLIRILDVKNRILSGWKFGWILRHADRKIVMKKRQ